MEGKGLLVLSLAALVSLASPECLEGDCNSTDTEQPLPVLNINLDALFPFLGPVDINDARNHFTDDAINPRLPSEEDASSADSSDNVMSVNVFEMIISRRNDELGLSEEGLSDEQPMDDSLISMLFRGNPNDIEDLETLDLSGQTLTGDALEKQLKVRILLGQPVSSLVLSNTRVQGLSRQHLQPVQDTLRKLSLDNCTRNLDLLADFSNLQFLNLSHNGLATFQWFPKLTDTLEELDLSHNEFVEVRPELSILTSLRKLNLSYNKIASVKEYPLSLLPSLEYLTLTMNSISDATFTELLTIQQLDLDWNYLRLAGYDLQLPAHSVSLKLASNPWRCDCGLLQARDENEVLDLDQLKCANQLQYAVCESCTRYFLPINDGRLVSNETKDSIEHLGCTGISDQFYLLRTALVQLRDQEPDKLTKLGCIVIFSIFLVLMAILYCKAFRMTKKFDRQAWLKVQQIPYLKIDKISKPQEVPYVKI